MNRFFLMAAFAALSIAVALFVLRFAELGSTEKRSSPVSIAENHPFDTENQRSFGGDETERGNFDISNRSFAPQGRFAGKRILDQRMEAIDSGIVRVSYLIEGEDPRIPVVFLEERYRLQSDDSQPALVFQSGAKGNEIMFDADPSRVDRAKLQAFVMDNGWSISWESRLSGYVQIEIANATIDSLEAALERLSSEFSNTLASLDHLHFTSAIPSEYSAPVLWHLDQVKAPDAWEFSTGSEGLVVAVIDTGCYTEHEDLLESIFVNPGEVAGNGIDDDGNGFIDDVSGWDFYDDDAIPNDETGHGTHVSGIVGARGNNGIGITGVNWNTRVLPLKVGSASGLSSSAIAEALRYVSLMKERGVSIVATNNSYGSSSENPVAHKEIKNHLSEGILFVAAAGNSGDDLDSSGASQFPAAFPEENVISVANSTQGDQLASGSNYGLISVDIAAPGQEVYSTYNDGGYRFLTGTSMSSPMVAGAIALVASHDPELSPVEIKQRLLDTAERFDALEGKSVSGGRLDLLAALEPGLIGHRVDVSSHPAYLTLLPHVDITVTFEIEALEDAIVSIEILSGGASIRVEENDSRSYSLKFSEDGVYRVRVLAEKNSIIRSIEKAIVVGRALDVNTGLLHSWDMEGVAGPLIDRAGSGNGEPLGATRVDTPLGRGVDFDGTDSSVKFTSRFSSQVTLSAFVKSDDLLSSPHPRIINAPDYYLYFSTRGIADIPDGNANALKFYSNRSEDFGVWHSPPDSIFEDEWIHVLASYDSQDLSNAPSLYINGEKQVVRTQRLPLGSQTKEGGEAFLGDREDGTRAWDGQMDEVRVYSRIVTDDEVSRLSARYLDAVWDDYEIRTDGPIEVGKSVILSLVNSDGQAPELAYEWSVMSEIGEVELMDSDQPELVATFAEADNARFILKASASSVTRYYYYDLFFDPLEIEAGVSIGQTSSGGVVWIEIDESLDRGYVTVLDEVSGFKRFREPVTIDFLGKFASSSQFSQRIVGEIDGSFSGSVEGTEIEFSGERTLPQSAAAGYGGHYSGGLLGQGGELLEMRVLENGASFVWLNGGEADLGQGSVNLFGEFELTTTLGSRFIGQIEAEKGEVNGIWLKESDEGAVYLREDQTAGVNRYANFSTRGFAQSGERIVIGGFVLAGSSPRTVLIRGVGPALAERNVSNVLEDPSIALYRGQEVLQRNGRWGEAENVAEIRAFSEKVGAEPFDEESLDAAMLVELDPGLYTVLLGSETGEGEALFEVFDDADAPERSLYNVSSRGMVIGQDQVLIGGFVVTGDNPKLVLIRGVGPGLAARQIVDPLEDPWIALYSEGESIASNDNWMDGSLPLVEGTAIQGPAAALKTAFESSGAFAFDSESKDSAMLVWLNPGLYTVILRGVDGAQGIALVEVYEIE